MTRGIILALFLVPASAPASAQLTSTTVITDLDGDGIQETFSLIDSGEGSYDLSIEGTSLGSIHGTDTAWAGGMVGQQPELAIAPNSSVQVISMNDSVGRDRWKLILTIAFRDGQYLVAGYTYEWSDTLDLDAYGICDVNLLAGLGEVSHGGEPTRGFPTTESALQADLWSEASFGPNDACFE